MLVSFDKIILATKNAGKVREFQKLCANSELGLKTPWLIEQLDSSFPDVEETGDTFEANAVLKAVAVAKALEIWALADDSGLQVQALLGEPGIYSSRYAGKDATDAENNARLLSELKEVANRKARFKCVLVLANPQGEVVLTTSGECVGEIAKSPEGKNGFGYDPIFVPNGFGKSMATLSADEKSAISHRGEAMQTMLKAIKTMLDE